MSDDKSKQDGRDDSRIADDELSYWATKWGVSRKTILSCIDHIGSHVAKDVEDYLKEIGMIPEEQ